MTETITDLWNGNLAPCEHCGSHDAEANHLLCLMERDREALREGMSAAQMEAFQKYLDCAEEYLLRMSELAFCDGFCLAGRLLAESLCSG